MLHAVDDVSFEIKRRTTLGVVGESGCGKSTLGRTILRLEPYTSGEVIYNGENILGYNKKQLRNLRQKMQMIFQDPYSSLNPRNTVYQLIADQLIVNKLYKDKGALEQRVLELMDIAGLSPRLVNSYPHELDGGRRQRIGLARALSMQPEFIVCDEPVSALDVSIQAQILNLLMDLQDQFGLTYLFITHDLSVVRHKYLFHFCPPLLYLCFFQSFSLLRPAHCACRHKPINSPGAAKPFPGLFLLPYVPYFTLQPWPCRTGR